MNTLENCAITLDFSSSVLVVTGFSVTSSVHVIVTDSL